MKQEARYEARSSIWSKKLDMKPEGWYEARGLLDARGSIWSKRLDTKAEAQYEARGSIRGQRQAYKSWSKLNPKLGLYLENCVLYYTYFR